MSELYPAKTGVFLALTRPAMIAGVSIEYLFFIFGMTLSVVILTNSLVYLLFGVILYMFGRIVFFWDCYLIAILMRYLLSSGNRLNKQLGQVYYDMGR